MGQSDPRLGEHADVGIFCPVFHHRFAPLGEMRRARQLSPGRKMALREGEVILGNTRSMELGDVQEQMSSFRWCHYFRDFGGLPTSEAGVARSFDLPLNRGDFGGQF